MRGFLLLVLLVFILNILTPKTVSACTPGGPNPWFKTHFTFDKSNLPKGVEIVETHPKYEPYAIKNTSPEPLYLVDEYNLSRSYYEEEYPGSELPSNYAPKYKLVSGKVYFYSQLSSSDPKGWHLNTGGINNSAATQVRVDESLIEVEGGLRNVYQDNKPKSVKIPEPQSFRILAYHKGGLLEITGIVNYRLNDEYDPKAFAKGVEACEKWLASQTLLSSNRSLLKYTSILLISTALLVSSAIAYRFLKKDK